MVLELSEAALCIIYVEDDLLHWVSGAKVVTLSPEPNVHLPKVAVQLSGWGILWHHVCRNWVICVLKCGITDHVILFFSWQDRVKAWRRDVGWISTTNTRGEWHPCSCPLCSWSRWPLACLTSQRDRCSLVNTGVCSRYRLLYWGKWGTPLSWRTYDVVPGTWAARSQTMYLQLLTYLCAQLFGYHLGIASAGRHRGCSERDRSSLPSMLPRGW